MTPHCASAVAMAEGVGFEPTIRFCRIRTFQARAFDRSATLPLVRHPGDWSVASSRAGTARNLAKAGGNGNHREIARKKENLPVFHHRGTKFAKFAAQSNDHGLAGP